MESNYPIGRQAELPKWVREVHADTLPLEVIAKITGANKTKVTQATEKPTKDESADKQL